MIMDDKTPHAGLILRPKRVAPPPPPPPPPGVGLIKEYGLIDFGFLKKIKLRRAKHQSD
jgi:hypothetical protein